MGTWTKASRWLVATGLGVVAGALVLGASGSALAAKPQPPPPSGKLIYYNDGATSYRMAVDGTGKALLAGTASGHVSDVRYGGTYWSVWTTWATLPKLPGDDEDRYRIVAWPVETAGGPISILNDASWKVTRPAFRPVAAGSAPKITFSAVHWTGTTYEAGLYEITLTTDGGGAITGADPTTLTQLIAGSVFTHVTPTQQTFHWSQLQGHDWLNPTKLVYGNDTFSNGGSLWAQLYLYDFAYPGVPPLALIAANQPRMVWGPAVNPSGTRVMYGNYTALYEVTTGGNATPTVFVAATSRNRGTTFDYLDDDWAVYGWQKTTSPFTSDVYRKLRGGSATNLTGDVSASCEPVAAR